MDYTEITRKPDQVSSPDANIPAEDLHGGGQVCAGLSTDREEVTAQENSYSTGARRRPATLAPLTSEDYHGSSPFWASDIAGMVPMVALLRELAFQVNERTHRGPCILHGGQNLTAFSWTEGGRWYCFNCGFGGDRIELVKRVRGCTFSQALQYLANLAGVDISDNPVTRKEIQKQKRERQRIETKEKKLAALECAMRGRYREEIVDLEEIRKKAGEQLHNLSAGAPERFKNETDFLWGALEFVAKHLPRVLAGYSICSFGSTPARERFVTLPDEREGVIDQALLAGYIPNDDGQTIEVLT